MAYSHLYGHLNYTGETISKNFLQLLFFKSEKFRNVQAKHKIHSPLQAVQSQKSQLIEGNSPIVLPNLPGYIA